ncbi:MAG TPA: hypothetical protein VFV81_02245, partial [Verrucomicrobiae bacterium]|nr:hypothetical protein [Verrucomicrobiae bacterium]
KGGLIWLHERPADFSTSAAGAAAVVSVTWRAARHAGLNWREVNYLLLRRGPYVIAAGLDESVAAEPKILRGHFVDLFDATLRVQTEVRILPGTRYFLLDLDQARTGTAQLLAAACKTVPETGKPGELTYSVEGVEDTSSVMLLESPHCPKTVTLDGKALDNFDYSPEERLLWLHFTNRAVPRQLVITW